MLTDAQRAEGWIEHDGGTKGRVPDDACAVLYASGIVLHCNDRQFWPPPACYIIAYRKEPSMTDTDAPVVPTQEDREAAADWFTLTNSLGIDHTGKAFENMLRDGSYDGDKHPLVQAFARHRIAAEQRARIAGERAGIEAAAGVGLRYERASGLTLMSMRDHISPELYAAGDCVLIWANEGDLTMMDCNLDPTAIAGAGEG